MKRPLSALLLVALLPLALAADHRHGRGKELLIGGLLSLTGDWSTLGKTGQAALRLAEHDVNAYFDSVDSKLSVRVLVEDTRLVPDRALDAMRSLARRGVRVFAGPQSSAEARVLKPVADADGLIVISPSSTAGTLSLPNDNLLRFCPDDSLEGDATAALIWAEGIRTVVPLWREDAGNIGLANALRSRFTTLGGTVLPGASYAATDDDPAAAVAAVGAQVQSVGTGPTVAVYLASFDEVVGVFHRAAANAALSSVRWYGSDGVALSAALAGDAPAAAYAVARGYPVPVFGLQPVARPKWQPIAAEIQRQTGLVPDAFALALYDEVWVAALTHLALEDGKGRWDDRDFRAAFIANASRYFGATGWTVLNANGDRAVPDFDFWALRGAPPVWTLVGRYDSGVLSGP